MFHFSQMSMSCLIPKKSPSFLLHSVKIYDAKENINPFWEIRAYTLMLKLEIMSLMSAIKQRLTGSLGTTYPEMTG